MVKTKKTAIPLDNKDEGIVKINAREYAEFVK